MDVPARLAHGCVVGAGRGVGVTTDLGLLLGRRVVAGDVQRPDTVGQRAQQRSLGRLGHGLGAGEVAAAFADHGEQHRSTDSAAI